MEAKEAKTSPLAIAGGKPIRTRPMPPRCALGDAEAAALQEAVAYYRDNKIDPGYQGVFEKRYTDAFVKFMGGGGHADAVATGTAALYVAVAALRLPAGSEVIVSPITERGIQRNCNGASSHMRVVHVDRLRAETRARQLAITTTTGFASLWLIPRLRLFTALYPDIDVRLSATTDTLNLERSMIDVAIRYCRPEAVPEGAVCLFGEEMIPVCSRALTFVGLTEWTRPVIMQNTAGRAPIKRFYWSMCALVHVDGSGLASTLFTDAA
jgi:hypothetical protein